MLTSLSVLAPTTDFSKRSSHEQIAIEMPATLRKVLIGPLIEYLFGLGRTRISKIVENTMKQREKDAKPGAMHAWSDHEKNPIFQEWSN